MVSTYKLVLFAISLQFILGAAAQLAIEPDAMPAIVSATGGGLDNIYESTAESDNWEIRNTQSVVESGDTGLNPITVIPWLFSTMLYSYKVTWFTPTTIESTLDNLLLWGLRIYMAIIHAFFAMELFMFVYSKKTS